MLSWFELAAFLSFLPGMFIFLYGFLLSSASTLAAHEMEKGRYILAGILLALFNLLPAAAGILSLTVDEYQPRTLALVLVYGVLAIWGFLAIVFQRKMVLKTEHTT